MKKNEVIHEFFDWLKIILFSLAFVLILQSQVFAFTEVCQSSMEDTLIEGQKLVMEKVSYSFSSPKRGDIVVMIKNSEVDGFIKKIIVCASDVRNKLSGIVRKDRYVKRIIAIGGDEISFIDGSVYVNKVKLSEPYVKSAMTDNNTITVPEGYVYVMGDNRAVSMDSRFFGPVNIDHIEGKVVFRILPINKMGQP
jgi:signal peptidase I